MKTGQSLLCLGLGLWLAGAPGLRAGEGMWLYSDPPRQQLKERHGSAGLNLQFNWPITKQFVSEVKAAGLKLLVWTVDGTAIAQRLADAGVEGITTNKPKWLREQLK